jgi:hypothetical protein
MWLGNTQTVHGQADNVLRHMKEVIMRALTAALSIESLGWKLLGPSSQMYPSPATDVMFPPTRSRPSVTMNLKAAHGCQSLGSVTCLARPK